MRYKVTFSYDGSNYHGWQIQPNGISVQETLQNTLSTLLRIPIEVVGAGRTDAGVHASMMTCHFDYKLDNELDVNYLNYKLNKLLPNDIAVQDVQQVPEDWHARFSAVSRTYFYYIHTKKDPFSRAYSWCVYGNLDFGLMNCAAQILMEYTDFTSFSKVNTDVKTNLCKITEAYWDEIEPGRWRFTITANRFLRNMVRAIVGTLIEVGRGRMSIEQLREVIEAKNRCRAGESVPGHALFLHEVRY